MPPVVGHAFRGVIDRDLAVKSDDRVPQVQRDWMEDPLEGPRQGLHFRARHFEFDWLDRLGWWCFCDHWLSEEAVTVV